jgi:hypothetical protein
MLAHINMKIGHYANKYHLLYIKNVTFFDTHKICACKYAHANVHFFIEVDILRLIYLEILMKKFPWCIRIF